MTIRTAALIVVLLLGLAFEGGVLFDRWLHRPLHAGGFTVEFPYTGLIPTGSAPPSTHCYSDGSVPCPIPDCIINCVPGDDAGNNEPEMKPRPFGTGFTKGETMCWWAPFGFNACQKET